jgi:hypothetical protein
MAAATHRASLPERDEGGGKWFCGAATAVVRDDWMCCVFWVAEPEGGVLCGAMAEEGAGQA